jgi:dihydrofolate synthase/folylpolyglutamate synthase
VNPPTISGGVDHDPIRASDLVIQRLRANHPVLIDLTTGRVERLLAALGHPERRLPPVIHVAGTNGKGSTVAYLRAIAEAQGQRVHAITSPHLVRFAERVRIAGELISDAQLEDLTDRLEAANDGAPISFFEITTVLALQAFADTPADICLVEVGLGGRFDATNVFDAPAVSVITPVDYDHLEMLGPELGKIAWEKAGIIKPSSARPTTAWRPCF